MKKEIKKWNKLNPDNSIKESDFNNFFCFQKMVYRVGVEHFVNNYPYSDHRQLISNNTITNEYLYDGLGWGIIRAVENSGGKFKPQKFFEIKKM